MNKLLSCILFLSIHSTASAQYTYVKTANSNTLQVKKNKTPVAINANQSFFDDLKIAILGTYDLQYYKASNGQSTESNSGKSVAIALDISSKYRVVQEFSFADELRSSEGNVEILENKFEASFWLQFFKLDLSRYIHSYASIGAGFSVINIDTKVAGSNTSNTSGTLGQLGIGYGALYQYKNFLVGTELRLISDAAYSDPVVTEISLLRLGYQF